MTTEEKFKAAVNVIRNLPKKGSYVPSNELQLKFYAYFKQSMIGPNKEPKPAFWDVVKRAKWNAWKDLGDTPKSVAMEGYIELLMSIIETMSYDQSVDAFLESVGSFYESVDSDDVDLVLGPVIAKIKSTKQTNGDEKTAEALPNGHYDLSSSDATELNVESDTTFNTESDFQDNFMSDDEEFCDSIATPIVRRKIENVDQNPLRQNCTSAIQPSFQVNEEYIEALKSRVANIEEKVSTIAEQNKMIQLVLGSISQELEKKRANQPWWKMFGNISGYHVAFFILYPLVAHWVFESLRKKR